MKVALRELEEGLGDESNPLDKRRQARDSYYLPIRDSKDSYSTLRIFLCRFEQAFSLNLG